MVDQGPMNILLHEIQLLQSCGDREPREAVLRQRNLMGGVMPAARFRPTYQDRLQLEGWYWRWRFTPNQLLRRNFTTPDDNAESDKGIP